MSPDQFPHSNVSVDGQPLRSSWRTVSFEPHRAGSAELFVDDEHRMTMPIAGWLIQDQCLYDEDGIQRATGGRRVVPGYFSPAGTVLPLADITFSLNAADVDSTVRFAVQLATDAAQETPPPVVNVTIEGQVDVAPKTRTVVRDDQGQITHVIEEAS